MACAVQQEVGPRGWRSPQKWKSQAPRRFIWPRRILGADETSPRGDPPAGTRREHRRCAHRTGTPPRPASRTYSFGRLTSPFVRLANQGSSSVIWCDASSAESHAPAVEPATLASRARICAVEQLGRSERAAARRKALEVPQARHLQRSCRKSRSQVGGGRRSAGSPLSRSPGLAYSSGKPPAHQELLDREVGMLGLPPRRTKAARARRRRRGPRASRIPTASGRTVGNPVRRKMPARSRS